MTFVSGRIEWFLPIAKDHRSRKRSFSTAKDHKSWWEYFPAAIFIGDLLDGI